MRIPTLTSAAIVSIGFIAALSVPPLFAQDPSATDQTLPAMSDGIATVNVEAEFIDIEPHIHFDSAVLRVAGPKGYALTRRVTGDDAFFITADLLLDAEMLNDNTSAGNHWESLPDGRYFYEVVMYSADGEHESVNGAFNVQGGRAIQPDLPVQQERQDDPISSIDDSNLLQRMAGAVLDFMVPSANAQSGDFDDFVSIRNTTGTGQSRLNLNATDSIGVNDDAWRLMNDADSNRFDIVQGSNTERLSIIQGGNVGIGTTAPLSNLHVVSSSGASEIRMEATGSTWTIQPGLLGFWLNEIGNTSGVMKLQNGSPANSIVTNSTGVGIGTASPSAQLQVAGDALVDTDLVVDGTTRMSGEVAIGRTVQPGTALIVRGQADEIAFRVQPNAAGGTRFRVDANGGASIGSNTEAPPNGLFVSGNTGIGTSSPSESLHVRRTDGTAQILVEETDAGNSTLYRLVNNGHVRFRMDNSSTGDNWEFRTTGGTGDNNQFAINKVGTPDQELRVDGQGNLIVRGSVFPGSSRSIKQDIEELDAESLLARLGELSLHEWSYTAAPGNRHIGPMAEDFHATFGLGINDKTISPSDMAGIALAAAQALQQKNAQVYAENRELRERLDRLEQAVLANSH